MFTRRIATAAVLLVLFGAACGGRSTGTKVAANAAPVVAPATTAPVATTTTTTAPAEIAPPTTAAAARPVVTSAPKPPPATIEVDYQPHDGATATATIDGPNGAHSKSLDSGAALFGGLPAGTYAVTVTIDTPSGDPTVGNARTILNGNSVHVEPGEHGVVTCDDSGCTGTL
jgi:hypothetical protein